MTLAVAPGYAPMEARIVDMLPVGPQWQYEPKWDGFRCLAFRDAKSVELMSKSGQPLTRYFPEVVSALAALKATRFVVDGEIVVAVEQGLSFDALLQRIHPARSRVLRLAADTPAVLLVFDLLVDARGNDLTGKPLSERRRRLDAFAGTHFRGSSRVGLSPATHRKRKRTVDCVAGGFRYASSGEVVGSVLLGLYDSDGILHHVGYTSGFTTAERRRLTPILVRLRGGQGFTGRAPGGPSRWSTTRSSEWEPLKTKLVAEVEYNHFTNGRFRHGTKFLRWRPDKAPAQCLLSQVAECSAASGAPRASARQTRAGR